MLIEVMTNYISLSTAWGLLCPSLWKDLISEAELVGSDGAYLYFRGDPEYLEQVKLRFYN